MGRGFSALVHSLSFRLLAGLLVSIAVVTTGYGALAVRTNSSLWMQVTEASANRMSELVRRATRYGMLLNRKEDVHQTIRQLAASPGVAGIRIYDKQGTIIFSADQREIGRKVDRQADACVVCHESAKPLSSVPGDERRRFYRTAAGEGIVALINPIENDAECARGACHAHPPDQTVLGVLDIQMSTASLEQTLRASKLQVIIATTLMGLIIGVLTVVFFQRVVRRPIVRLYEGTRRVAGGDLDTRIETSTRDELGQLAQAFNQMTADLKRAREELTGWSQQLEHKVVEKTEELGRAQRQMVQMDKMASLGKLSATVAHELNNPLAGILTYAKLVGRELAGVPLGEEQRGELTRYVDLIQKESARCGGIVKNLLLFSRRSGAALAPTHLNEVVGRALMLMNHPMQMASVQLDSHPLAGDDILICDADQVQQALVALLVNAIEAMQSGGTLGVQLTGDAEAVVIAVKDTGAGIPAEILPHIFEPFFSTKDKESGVGLGLAVVYGIVQRHAGTIEVDSAPGQGTTFRLRLPRRPEQVQAVRKLA